MSGNDVEVVWKGICWLGCHMCWFSLGMFFYLNGSGIIFYNGWRWSDGNAIFFGDRGHMTCFSLWIFFYLNGIGIFLFIVDV
jgi:hypothetical protein